MHFLLSIDSSSTCNSVVNMFLMNWPRSSMHNQLAATLMLKSILLSRHVLHQEYNGPET